MTEEATETHKDIREAPPDPNLDLLTMDVVALSLEYQRLKEKAEALASGSERSSVQALDDQDLERYCRIVQIKRRLSGGQPKDSATKPRIKKEAKPSLTLNDLMKLG